MTVKVALQGNLNTAKLIRKLDGDTLNTVIYAIRDTAVYNSKVDERPDLTAKHIASQCRYLLNYKDGVPIQQHIDYKWERTITLQRRRK